ncbi:MAG: tRNA uridine-5-carboxymethylaminomethyl(34) synthesis GTPase MnmE [Thermodesulfobacteriota bacterium]
MDCATIAAIATPPGSAGIGIIKISGPDAVAIAAAIFNKTAPHPPPPADTFMWETHRLYHGHIIDPDSGRTVDEVLLSVMRAPHSYTGEDVAEINSHSGMIVLRTIMELVLRKGARLAAPGEFTKRAFLNGRIDLTQAEAVVDIINARTEKSLDIAAAHIKGEFKESIFTARNALLNLMALMEAAIDFPEDVEPVQIRIVKETLQEAIEKPLMELVAHYHSAHILRDGLNLAVVGRPNVGKSSLMNRLIQKDRVIVSPIPGTTRDFIEETLNIHGIPVIIADTAGLHDTQDPLEALGVQKTREYISRSDLVLFMIDASVPLTPEDHQIFETVKARNVILVLNKQDLLTDPDSIGLPDSWHHLPQVRISALFNQGIDRLKDLIVSVSMGDDRTDLRIKIIPNLRHKQLLDKSLQAIRNALAAIGVDSPIELVSIDLQEATDALAEIIGINVKEDILDQIFSRFCIGK